MDHAVALVQSYLYVNGFLTVTEHPVLEVLDDGRIQTATDIDIVAYRTPRSGGLTTAVHSARSGPKRRDAAAFQTDPALRLSDDRAEMLIIEVKQGRAELNRGATSSAVLEAVLRRFGCCGDDEVHTAVGRLRDRGEAQLDNRLRIRLIAFGASTPSHRSATHEAISLGHVVRFLEGHLRRYWPALKTAQVSDPAFGFLLTLEKARRSSPPHAERAREGE